MTVYFSDDFEDFPTGWTTGTGNLGTITKSNTHVHTGDWACRVYSPNANSFAYAYDGIVEATGDFHVQFWIYIDAAVEPDVVQVLYMYDVSKGDGPVIIDLDFHDAAYYIQNRAPGPAQEDVGTISAGAWHKIDAYFKDATDKIAYYIDDVPQGDFDASDGTADPDRIYVGDGDGVNDKGFYYLDGLIVDNAGEPANLPCGFIARQPGSAELLGEFHIRGWLPGWAKRVKLSIDSGDITAALSNFPLLVYLSNSSGINSEDITFIFDEVGANSLKIAVTEDDGESECYVEVEKWDNGAEEAWLWVKVPSVASGTDTVLYLYYDNTHADNDTYVGVKESAPGEAVWDSSFLMVQHMDEAAGNIKDSTSKDRDGTQGQTPTYGQTGEIDDAIEFDGTETTGDFFQLADHAELSFAAFTWEVWVYLHDKSVNSEISEQIACKSGAAGSREWQFNLDRAAEGDPWKVRPILGKADGNWGKTDFYSTGTVPLNALKHIVVTWDGTTIKIYLEGAFDAQVGYNDTIKDTGATPYIARSDTTWQYFDGILDEFRFSSIARTPAWIEATYETGRDHLLDWGGEEGRVSEELFGEFIIRRPDSEELLGEFISQQAGSAELLAYFISQKLIYSQELLAEFVVDDTHSITGITKDNAGNRLGNCEIALFMVEAGAPPTYTFIEAGTSDGNGDYTFTGLTTRRFFVRAQKDGAPNVFDTTDNELEPV